MSQCNNKNDSSIMEMNGMNDNVVPESMENMRRKKSDLIQLLVIGLFCYAMYTKFVKTSSHHVSKREEKGYYVHKGGPHWESQLDDIRYTNIMDSVPPQYLAEYKNPCWVDRGNFQCLPYFYIIGFQKCGTTDLFLRLVTHHQIQKGDKKETFWWNKDFFRAGEKESKPSYFLDGFRRQSQIVKTECEEKKKCDMILGEATADSVIMGNENWKKIPGNEHKKEPEVLISDMIHHVTPGAKIIAMVREPADRLFSDYLYYNLQEKKSNKIFHERVSKSIDMMNECISKHSAKACVYNGTLHDLMPVRLHVGMYIEFIRDWMKVFPKEQTLVIALDDVMKDFRGTMTKVQSLLQVDPAADYYYQFLKLWSLLNPRKQSSDIGEILPETRAILCQFYKPYTLDLWFTIQRYDINWTSC